MLSAYFFGNGDIATSVLNAVATLTNGGNSTYQTAFTIAAIFSVPAVMIYFFRQASGEGLKTLIIWFVSYFAATAILLTPKISLQVIDASNLGATYTVDNVPYVVGMPLSTATTVSYGLTSAFDDIFHAPDDLEYSSTGMLFGSKQMLMATSAQITDTQTRYLFSQYFSRCIVSDVLINHKYSFNDLASSTDIMGFLASQPQSPVRGLYDASGTFMTCKDAFTQLQTDMKNDVDKYVIPEMSQKLYHSSNLATAEQQLNSSLPITYQYFTNLSQSAEQILTQNTAIDGLRNGNANYAASNSATAALNNYAEAKSENTILMSNMVVASEATYFLPLIQTVLLLFLVGVGPLIPLLLIQPYFGYRVVVSYLGAYLWLCSWPIGFAIINYVMNMSLSTSPQGLTYSNADQISYDHSQMAGIAGYMQLAVPILMFGLIRGMAGVLSRVAQYMFGQFHSVGGQVGGEMASGNVSMGNASLGNESFDNLSAHKHDDNFTLMHGQSSFQESSGVIDTFTGSGQEVFNTSGAISNLAVTPSLSSGMTHSLAQTADKYHQAAAHEQASFNESVNASYDAMANFSESEGSSHSLGEGMSASQATSFNEGLSEMNSATHDYAVRHGVSDQEAYQHLMLASLHGGGSFGGGEGLKGSVGVNVNAQTQSSHDHSETDGASNDESHSLQQQFRDGMDKVQSATENTHFDASHSDAANQVSQFANDLRTAQTHSDSLSADLSMAEKYSQSASLASSEGVNVGENLTPAFQSYVENELGQTQAEQLFASTTPNAVATQQAMAEQFMQTSEGQQLATDFANHAQSSGQIDSLAEQAIGVVDGSGSASVDSFSGSAGATVAEQASGSDTGIHQQDVTDFKNSVSDQQAGAQNNLQDGRQGVDAKGGATDKQAVDEINKTHDDVQGTWFRKGSRLPGEVIDGIKEKTDDPSHLLIDPDKNNE